MKLKSVFEQSQEIPFRYTCLEANISPPLHFEYIPNQTKTKVIVRKITWLRNHKEDQRIAEACFFCTDLNKVGVPLS